MVRAMLAGIKTETRRLKPRKIEVGDELWVKEALRARIDPWLNDSGDYDGPFVTYPADGAVLYEKGIRAPWRWKRDKLPGMFMPRELSRIQRVVTGVRTERLHDISDNGVWAEGLRNCFHQDIDGDYWVGKGKASLSARNAYRDLWEFLHGPGSWDANPEVQVISWAVNG
jgi:hypothetical protein